MKHPGRWKKKQYRLGRYSGGGYWSCCGSSDKLATPCDPIMQERWKLFQIAADSSMTKSVVRRALAGRVRSKWHRNLTVKRHDHCVRVNIGLVSAYPMGHTFGTTHHTCTIHNVPMLVKSLRNADHQRAVNESLRAACALCGTEVGCIALVRHGMLEVVQHFIMQLMENMNRSTTVFNAADDHVHHPSELLQEAQMLCAGILAALAKCDATRDCLSARPKTALAVFGALLNSGRHTSYRCNLLTSLVAATTSSASQHALLFFCHRGDSDAPTKGLKHKPHPLSFHTIVENIWLGLSYLGEAENVEPGPATSPIPSLDRQQIQFAFVLLQMACRILEQLSSYDSSAGTTLRDAGVAETCFSLIAAIQNYTARRNDEVELGINALAAAVAMLQQVTVVLGDIHASLASSHALPIIYGVLRSQLSQTSIQQNGIQLVHTLVHTRQGARELDGIPGAWLWLGNFKSSMTKKGESCLWRCKTEMKFKEERQGWSAPRLATFLHLHGLKGASCDQLHRNARELYTLALLPFEDESTESWQSRLLAFEERNKTKLLASIVGRGHLL